MIYTCDYCHFNFRRTGEIEKCPDCGKSAVREATEKEKDEYKKRIECEKITEKKKG